MKPFKIHEGLSDYLLTDEGKVFNKNTNEPVQPLATKPPQYLLTTDEFANLFMNNNRFQNVRLKRRFTAEDIVKMYAAPKATVYVQSAPDQLKETVTNITPISYPDSAIEEVKASSPKKEAKPKKEKASNPAMLKLPYFKINEVDYQSARQASKALGIAVNTVLSKAKKNKDGFFFIEK